MFIYAIRKIHDFPPFRHPHVPAPFVEKLSFPTELRWCFGTKSIDSTYVDIFMDFLLCDFVFKVTFSNLNVEIIKFRRIW